MSNLSDRLLQLKNERNLLQKDIAKDNDISLRAYRYYETGERQPTADVLIKLADYFHVPVDYLLGRGVFANENSILANKDIIIESLANYLGKDSHYIQILKSVDDRSFMMLLSVLVNKIEIDENTDEVIIHSNLPKLS